MDGVTHMEPTKRVVHHCLQLVNIVALELRPIQHYLHTDSPHIQHYLDGNFGSRQ